MNAVVVIGDANVDLSVRLPARSGNREQPPPPVLTLGGTAANTAVALAQLGVGVSFIGMVGDDGYGRFVRRELDALQIDTRQLHAHAEAFTTQVLAIVDADGERTLFGWPRRGSALTYLEPAQISADVIAQAQWLHTTGMCLVESPTRDAILHAMTVARDSGVPVSFDLNLRIGFRDGRFESGFIDTIERAITLSDVVLGSAVDELSHLGADWQTVVRRLCQERTVVARLGNEGVRAYFGDQEVAMPAIVVPVISTLGAGDAFNAGFIAAMVEIRGLKAALARGNAVAALKISGQPIDAASVKALSA